MDGGMGLLTDEGEVTKIAVVGQVGSDVLIELL